MTGVVVEAVDVDEAIRGAIDRLAALHGRASAATDSAGVGLDESITYIRDALEELEVASQELDDRAEALARSQARYAELFAMAPDGLLETTLDGVIAESNHEACRLLAMPGTELAGKSLHLFVRPGERAAFVRFIAAQTGSPEPGHLAIDLLPRGRRAFPASIVVTQIGARDGIHLLWDVRDDRLQRRLRRQLSHQATHDPLTGLASRAELYDRLAATLAAPPRPGPGPAVLLIDVDRLTPFNDRLGHHVGDAILRTVAERIQRTKTPSDLTARVDGDEFALVLADGGGPTGPLAIGEELRQRLAEPMVIIDNQPVQVSVTVGAALAEPGATADSLMGNAAHALRAGKERGGGRCELFGRDLDRRRRVRRLVETEFLAAIEHGALRVAYQPMIGPDGRICGVESLARWDHPVAGPLVAGDFVPAAEQTGLIRHLDAWMLRQACLDAGRWPPVEDGDEVIVYVNLSSQDLIDPRLFDAVGQALALSGLPARRLCLELTERDAIDDRGPTADLLARLRSAGVGLAIDDFGTGYSALSYLRDLPVTALKLDASFAAGIDDSARDRLIVAAVAQAANAMDLVTIAEGVESDGQRRTLFDLGCDALQGYHVARPCPSDEIAALLAGGVTLPARA